MCGNFPLTTLILHQPSGSIRFIQFRRMNGSPWRHCSGIISEKRIRAAMNANLSSHHLTNIDSGWINHLDELTAFETEKRRHARYPAQQEVICTFYDILKDDFENLNARVENKSAAGLMLTANKPLQRGMPILVRLKHFSENDAEDELKDGIHAQVVRCDEIFSADERPCYQIAAEYFELCNDFL